MQVVIIMMIGSLALGLISKKLDRKAYIGLGLLVGFALVAYLYLRWL
jgi:hypothetical protein